ncbi:alpha-tocopherol transfer protein-like [Orussus abietinus]|uniref:alpha-tocopherol transfer protein-like n=1 Tax=Orussus abietinus TaxID=222816 RepID=UPI000626DFE8|nr:alpha-tocopherol transfer protein-like [Orussus abietinus]XP_012289207.1 alpha-tocopherol transfer protein-like [Orussus abietinus]XP_012289209.1 alpha-tocopherol transfer protein-like [Orussus abietinus]XP_012289210.1 alpha-tocopherol transfer protein-like [Orussus abietinus]
MAIPEIAAAASANALKERLKTSPKLYIGETEFVFQPVEEMDEFFTEKALKELRETPEIREEGYKALKELLKGEPDLYLPTEEEYLKKFLRPCKWYPKSAMEMIKRFYRYRLSHPRICNNLVPSMNREIFVSGILTPMPLRLEDGCRLLLIESGRKWKPKEISLEQILRGVMIILEAAMAEPITQISGVHVILDMDGLSLSQVTYFSPSFASAVLEWVQKCVPCRLKGVHVVNQPYIFNMVFAIFKPFLQEKLRNRLHFHGTNRQTLLSHIGVTALPTKFGGNLKIPEEPVGETLWNYFCIFEEAFQASSKCGYPPKEL